MLDIKFIRDNPEVVKKAIVDKNIDLDLDSLLELDQKRRSLLSEVETFQATKNQFSQEVQKLTGGDRDARILEMKEIDSRQTELQGILREIGKQYQELLLRVPNIPAKEAPVGKDESANLPWTYWSAELGHVDPKEDDKVKQIPTQFAFDIKDHITLGRDLDLIDIEAGVKTSGFRGYYLKNEAVLLQYGLMWYALEKMQAKGFTMMIPPVVVREFALVGSGHFPAGRDEIYRITNAGNVNQDGEVTEDKEAVYLAGTSEPALLAYYADKIIEEKDLPIKVCGITPCYRSEIGSYGKDTKGIYRVHEFMKVEQVVLCKGDNLASDEWLEQLRQVSEEILQELKLPYRVLNICTGDMGAGKYKMYDIETWIPSRKNYGETHSDSNLTDWQARRLNIKYRDKDGKLQFVHTLNNTAIASARTIVAILENYQQADGTVKVPDVLKKYVGKDVIGKAPEAPKEPEAPAAAPAETPPAAAEEPAVAPPVESEKPAVEPEPEKKEEVIPTPPVPPVPPSEPEEETTQSKIATGL